jgi:hypothetical protein
MDLLINITNELAVDDAGWAQIAPMGDFPGMALKPDGMKVKAIQRIDSKAIANMVNDFVRRPVKKFLAGCPIFVGHPDVPGPLGKKYTDKGAKGVFVELAARDDGFYGKPIFTNEGRDLIDTKTFRALSGRWEAQPDGEDENGVPIYRPTRFISAGLTNTPNLPVQLLNEVDPDKNQNENHMKKETVIALLMGLGVSGITLANDATDEQVTEAIKLIGAEAKKTVTLANEKSEADKSVTKLNGEIATLKSENATLKTDKTTLANERDTARTAFANERTARIDKALGAALEGGRITAAEKATWETRLKNEATFANELAELEKLGAKLKTTSVTINRGDRKVEISNAADRKEMVIELVNERMKTAGDSYDAAFAFVQKTHPTLFAAMEQAPEVRKGGPKKS